MNDEYRTSDLGLAAALRTLKYEFKEIERDKHKEGKFVFVFYNEIGMKRVAQEHYRNALMVISLEYDANLKFLKSLIHSEKNNK